MDIDISVSKREISKHKVAVKQFESETTTLKFTLDSYKVDQVDLRNYKAYVITSYNGLVDMKQLQMNVSGSTITLIWVVQEKVLRHYGAITYQIAFKGSAEDKTSVFMTYEAILQCSESIDADRPIAANYPTVLKQWFDLMQTLSGAFGSEIVYMPVGESIPLEERLDGRVYYQWSEVPTTRAKCATGTVNLGERPYADAGLYINNTHVYVDNTSDTAYAIEPETWVDAINAANCGVTATSISISDEIILQIMAAKSGTYGNYIPISLGVAQYGAGKGITNPCGGHVSGTTLVGGTNAKTGVNYPTGQFEDAHGNILGYSRARYVPNADLNTLLENGEYICAGTMENNPVIGNTYCVVKVTDSSDSSRVVQECYCVKMSSNTTENNTVRVFVRALINASDAGEWRELVTEKQMNEQIKSLKDTLNETTANQNASIGDISAELESTNANLDLKQDKNTGVGDRVLITNSSGEITPSPYITPTELNSLDGYNTSAGTVESRLVALNNTLAAVNTNVVNGDNNLQSQINNLKFTPNYGQGVAMWSGMTVPVDALVVVFGAVRGGLSLAVNGAIVAHGACGDAQGDEAIGYVNAPVRAGSTVTFVGTATYYPYS